MIELKKFKDLEGWVRFEDLPEQIKNALSVRPQHPRHYASKAD